MSNHVDRDLRALRLQRADEVKKNYKKISKISEKQRARVFIYALLDLQAYFYGFEGRFKLNDKQSEQLERAQSAYEDGNILKTLALLWTLSKNRGRTFGQGHKLWRYCINILKAIFPEGGKTAFLDKLVFYFQDEEKYKEELMKIQAYFIKRLKKMNFDKKQIEDNMQDWLEKNSEDRTEYNSMENIEVTFVVEHKTPRIFSMINYLSLKKPEETSYAKQITNRDHEAYMNQQYRTYESFRDDVEDSEKYDFYSDDTLDIEYYEEISLVESDDEEDKPVTRMRKNLTNNKSAPANTLPFHKRMWNGLVNFFKKLFCCSVDEDIIKENQVYHNPVTGTATLTANRGKGELNKTQKRYTDGDREQNKKYFNNSMLRRTTGV